MSGAAPTAATPGSAPRRLRAALARTWATPRGLWGSLTTVDHKAVGRRYIVTAFVFLCLGGLAAMAMRAQLARPGEHAARRPTSTTRSSPCTARR